MIMNVDTHRCTCVRTIKEREAMNLQKGVHGMCWREESDGRKQCSNILISKTIQANQDAIICIINTVYKLFI